MSEAQSHPYQGLTPDTILHALESLGLRPDGGMLALNSYENRVYQIGIEEAAPLVAKFYRPERWSDAAILEEHAFSLELAREEIPVIAPLTLDGVTLHRFGEFRFSLFPRRGGRWPELEDPDNLEWIGRFLGRIHQLGASRGFEHRLRIDPETLGYEPVRFRTPARTGAPLPGADPGAAAADRGTLHQRRTPHHPPARRLPPGQHSLDRRRTPLRGHGRLPHRSGNTGPLDAAVRGTERDGVAVELPARGLRDLP